MKPHTEVTQKGPVEATEKKNTSGNDSKRTDAVQMLFLALERDTNLEEFEEQLTALEREGISK